MQYGSLIEVFINFF